MTIFFVVLALAVIAVVAVLIAGRVGQLSDPVVDRYQPELPFPPLAAGDISKVRLPVAIRGYRMQDVDELVDRLAESLRIREAQIAALSSTVEAHVTSVEDAHEVPDVGVPQVEESPVPAQNQEQP